MPPFAVGPIPSSFPVVGDEVNILTIALRPSPPGAPKQYTPLSEFSVPQKVALCDLIIARGYQSAALPLGYLRHHVGASYIPNKEDRKVHLGYSNLLIAGTTLEREMSSDELAYNIFQNPSLLDFTRPRQGPNAIRSSIIYKVPTRFVTIPSPELQAVVDRFSHDLALLLPPFLNSRRLRVNWSELISPFEGDSEYGAQKNTFKVITEFPEEWTGKSVGYEAPEPSTTTTVTKGFTGTKVLSAIIPDPPSPSKSISTSAAGKKKATESDDEAKYEKTYNEIDLDAILSLVHDVSEKAASDELSRQTQQRVRLRTPSSKAITPSQSQILTICEEDFDESAGNWIYDPPYGSKQGQSPGPSGTRQRSRGQSFIGKKSGHQ
ncbi:hypothetical protein SCHPADRAFT_897303 [Schizopora paradoxa]|uniref:Uncharacterized protein n=1 Tax=Schizopora paradoxa TaxID=27342 RepID=A0A0H2QXJ3_9AGAM|nr:hypothetical protein SCHPADRAFT_897303 [Schizopora paradoxa]